MKEDGWIAYLKQQLSGYFPKFNRSTAPVRNIGTWKYAGKAKIDAIGNKYTARVKSKKMNGAWRNLGDDLFEWSDDPSHVRFYACNSVDVAMKRLDEYFELIDRKSIYE